MPRHYGIVAVSALVVAAMGMNAAIPSRKTRRRQPVLDVNKMPMKEFTDLLRKECSSCHKGFGKVISNILRKTGKDLSSEWSSPHKGETKDKFFEECFSDYWTHGKEVLELCNGGSALDTVASYLANALKGMAVKTLTMDASEGFAFTFLVALTVELLLDSTCKVTLGSDVQGICDKVIKEKVTTICKEYAPQGLQDCAANISQKSSNWCSRFWSWLWGLFCGKKRKSTPLHAGHKRTIRFLKARAARMDDRRKAGLRYRRRTLQMRLCSETLRRGA